MGDSFEPQGAFEGYVYSKLETIKERLDGLPCKADEERIRKLEGKVANIEGKATVFGAVAGVCAAWLKSVIWK